MTLPTNWISVGQAIDVGEATGAVIGVSIISPTGERFSHNGDRRFVAASTVKTAILIELFRQLDAGEQSLDAEHRLRVEDKATGGGVLAQLHDGIGLTIGDLAYLMMSISDNSAANILSDRVGADRVNATMLDLGMHGSKLARKFYGRHLLPGEQENWAVPDDYSTAIEALLDGRAASPAACAQMITLMEKQQNDRRIARHLPQDGRPRWGSKTGSLPGVINDVGFVMTPRGPLVLSVFCEAPTDARTGEQIIGDIAKAAFDREL